MTLSMGPIHRDHRLSTAAFRQPVVTQPSLFAYNSLRYSFPFKSRSWPTDNQVEMRYVCPWLSLDVGSADSSCRATEAEREAQHVEKRLGCIRPKLVSALA